MERYRSLGNFLKEKFGTKVYKVSLHGGFSCPNRDGTKGTGGCIYCNPESNRPFIAEGKTIKDQLAEGIGYVIKRHRAAKFISYFQHFSNTYGDIKSLEKMYRDAIDHKDVVGLAVSTRPDCLTDETLKLLQKLNNETFLWVELGLQSANDNTLKYLNRFHTVRDFSEAISKLNNAGVMTCAHIILGIPNENHNDMMATVDYLNKHNVGGVKIHNLHILKDTQLAKMYEMDEVKTLSQNEYATYVVDALERFNPAMLIHRFNSHSPRDLTIAPDWSVNKLGTLNAVHDELERRNTWQGKLFVQL